MCIQKIKASANYERIKNSLELRTAIKFAVYYAALAISFALTAFLINFRYDASRALVIAVFLLVVLLPVSLFYVRRIFKIFRDIDDYTFTEVKLSRLNSSWYRNMYFSVDLIDWDGQTVHAETNSIFQTHGFMKPLLEDYVNRTVFVGYNNTTGYVSVIG